MPEPSLALLQTLIERLIVEQRQVVDRLERVERALLLLSGGVHGHGNTALNWLGSLNPAPRD